MSSRGVFYTAFFFYAVLRRMLSYAAVVYGFEILGGGHWSGLFYLCLVLPYLLSLPAGSIIDASSKRKMLLFTATATAGVMLTLAAAEQWRWFGTGPLHGAFMAALILGIGVASAFAYPTFVAVIPELLEPAQVGPATVMINALGMITVGCAPLIVGALRTMLPWPALFAIFAITAAIGWLLLTRLKLPDRRGVQAHGSEWQRLRELYAYCRQQPRLVGVFAALGVFSILGLGPLEVLSPLYAEKSLALSPLRAGGFIAVGGTGLVAGALGALKFIGRERLGRTLCGLAVGGGVLMVVLTFVPTSAAIALFFLSGILGGIFTSLSMAGAQAIAPDALRGRVMGLFTVIFGAAPALGGVLAGGVAGAFGTVAAMRIIFTAAIVSFVVLYATLSSLRQR